MHRVYATGSIEELIGEKREAVLRLAAARGARKVRVFGSVARGDATPESDVDSVVQLDEDRTLFDLGNLLLDLEDLLGRKVDLVLEEALHPYIRGRVLREAVML